MKRTICIALLVSITFFSFSQNDTSYKGIKWATGLSWEQVKAKAKAENKYIFVDCYATWCVPCKKMDAEVYPLREVGDYYNRHYISVKLQMDRTSEDDTVVKMLYKEAAYLQATFSITSFPSFLFFSSEGKPAHKVSGFNDPKSFIQIGEDAQDTVRQYYSVIRIFQPGKLDTSELKALALSFRFTDKALASKMALDYLSRISRSQLYTTDNLQFIMDMQGATDLERIVVDYLKCLSLRRVTNPDNLRLIELYKSSGEVQKIVFGRLKKLNHKNLAKKNNLDLLSIFNNQPDAKGIASSYIEDISQKEIYTVNNIMFIRTFAKSSSDIAFKILYNNIDSINKYMVSKGTKNGFAAIPINTVITREEILPYVLEAKKIGVIPEWERIRNNIEKKYSLEYADKNINNQAVQYYYDIKDWRSYCKSIIILIDMYGINYYKSIDGAFYLNNRAWDVFMRSNEKSELEKAISWSNVSIELCDVAKDTLHYQGYLDTKANLLYKIGKTPEAISIEEKALAVDSTNKAIAETLKKMKNSIPTWINN